MDMREYTDANLLIVCPNEEKMKILTQLSKQDAFFNIKFMTKEEYKNNYFFSYDDRALAYLISNYNLDIDVAKVYLKNLYVVFEDEVYEHPKLVFLAKLKRELDSKGLLVKNSSFKQYLNDKKVIVKNYYELEKYEEVMLNIESDYTLPKVSKKVIECRSIEDEVNYVCLRIIELLNQNVDINKIYLTNVGDEYLYIIKKLFSYYKIPINIDMKNSIYGTKVVKDYLETNELDLSNQSKYLVNRCLTKILSELSFASSNDKVYRTLLVDKLKNTYIPPKKYVNAVNIKNLYNEEFYDDEYVFVLGLNQDVLPTLYKDLNYLDDSAAKEVSLYTTSYLNKRSKMVFAKVISGIKNCYLSYKLSSPFASFYKSSIIDDLNLEVEVYEGDKFCYSNIYNKIRLAEKLDLYYLYGTVDKDLSILNANHLIPYKEYSNKFNGIDRNLYLEKLPCPLNMSYTSLNCYNECRFKYYIRHVLKLENYTDSFASFIGSLYHDILSLYMRENFDFDYEYNKYLENRELTFREKLFLVKIKKDLVKLITVLKKQQLITGYDEVYCEKKIEIPIRNDISVVFKGYIDKIMFYRHIEDTYFSIIDYKTGTIDTRIEPMKYGLHMQLPVYLYLIHYSKVFSNPIFTGIYYQNILFNYPTWSGKDLTKIYEEKTMLQGYSTDNTDILGRFDSTYEKSEYIKGMSYNEDKGFGTYSKVINDDTLYNLVKYTKKHIDNTVDNILKADFSINPKVYDSKNVSCEFCTFRDLCYMKDSDLTYLDKVDDLSFLGGE